MEVGEGNVEVNELYQRYQFECLEGDLGNPVGLRVFTDSLQQLFPEVQKSRKIEGKKKKTFYGNLKLKDNQVHCQNSNFHMLPEFLKSFDNVSVGDGNVYCEIKTGCTSNGAEIKKSLKFYENSEWNLTVNQTEIDLSKLGILNKFDSSQEGINLIHRIVTKLNLCCGVNVTNNVVVSRFHLLENWQSPEDDRTKRILRSLSCSKIININAISYTCVTCQKMTFKTQDSTTDANVKNSVKGNSTISIDDFRKLIPGATESMLEVLVDQAKNIERSPTGRRWSKPFLTTCLQLYSRSPHAYEILRSSGILLFPSTSILVLYKNAINQDVGFHEEVFEWMYEEASRKQLTELGWSGGLIFDEMAIQEDLQISKSGNEVIITGFTNTGDEGNMCKVLNAGNKARTLGTHILQIVFLGLTGFRFPIAHFITSQVQAPELFSLFWDAVNKIERFGFQMLYTCMDGAQCNRTFMHIHIPNTKLRTFSVPSPCSLSNVIFLMDFSHVMKKIRNNVIKSGLTKFCTRLLTLANGLTIQWKMFVDAFEWDQQNCLSLHRKLTHEHLYPNSQEKMRNHLAEEVLNEDMLNLMLEYKASLGQKGDILEGVIEFLQKTSTLIKIFRDKRPIYAVDDSRLKELKIVCDWFYAWNIAADNSAAKDRYKSILSMQCHEDIQACGIGFIQLCSAVFTKKNAAITPGLVNSDVVENHFNQQRSTYHGANTNPNALQYCKAQNSVIVGQSAISKKANAARSTENTMPYSFATNKPLRRHQKREHSSNSQTVPKKFKAIRL